MSTNCAPTYNFYNCCCEDKINEEGSGNSGQSMVNRFLIRSAADQIMSDYKTGDMKFAAYSYPIKPIGGSLLIYNNIQVMHFKYRLHDLSFIKFNEAGVTGKQMSADVVVMDMNGAILRTISTSPILLVGSPVETWLPFQLTTNTVAREILVGEVVMIRFTISGANNDNWQCVGNCSGLGEFV